MNYRRKNYLKVLHWALYVCNFLYQECATNNACWGAEAGEQLKPPLRALTDSAKSPPIRHSQSSYSYHCRVALTDHVRGMRSVWTLEVLFGPKHRVRRLEFLVGRVNLRIEAVLDSAS